MKITFPAFLLLLPVLIPAQVIVNAYAKITGVTSSSVLAVSNVDQTNHTFNVGDRVIVMQMQDDVIGSNTNNNSSFGLLSGIANAGNYEVRTIASRTPASGTPTSIRVSPNLSNTYNTGSNSSVQLISYRYLGNTYTTTADITGLAWDGNVGGVIAIEVNDAFTLNHRITADGIGFAGGAASSNADETCATGSYRLNDANKGYKGDGIYKRTSNTYKNGRARILTGGGGGSENNTGGGGGGNYTAGGNGGLGYQCTTGNSGYALGGITLSTSISSSRVFMGGGGGGGQENNSVGTDGGNGGGIILLKTTTLITTSTCASSIRISAEGASAANSGNDGSGGGGAGGSIVLQVKTYSVTSTCPLVNSASGGSGGNVTDPAAHGGGGGGGQGVVIYSLAQPTANVTTSVTNGAAGTDNSGGTTTSTGGGGTSGTGVVTGGGSGPLPVSLVSFYAEKDNERVKLVWETASEKNNDLFTVERSQNGIDYSIAGTVKGAGTSSSYHAYQLYDEQPYNGLSYYRLKQTDFSSQYDYSPVVSIDMDKQLSFAVFPNPVEAPQRVQVAVSKNTGRTVTLHVFDLTGKEFFKETLFIGSDENAFSFYTNGLEKGVYVLQIESDRNSDFRKLIVK